MAEMDDDSETEKALLELQLPRSKIDECPKLDLAAVNFRFPFKPYLIQIDFMRELFSCIENGFVGIFESPTGTGKSLSLICGSLAWLEKMKKSFVDEAVRIIDFAEKLRKEQETSDDWLTTYESTKTHNDSALAYKKQLDNLKSLENRLTRIKRGIVDKTAARCFKSSKRANDDEVPFQDEIEPENDVDGVDREFLLDDYCSGDETDIKSSSPSTAANFDSKANKDDELYTTKIFYATRTHSQISQFVNELKRTEYSSETRVVTLGSRQNMCVNESVKKLGSANLINDKCLQLQTNRTNSDKTAKLKKENSGSGKRPAVGCPYFRVEANRNLADEYLARVQDIEEMVDTAKKSKCCPYYASRYAVPEADLVLAPYQILLSDSTRGACNIRLSGNVVIIDEAHNLIDSINAVNSCKVDYKCLEMAASQLSAYLSRFKSRLNPSNLLRIRQLTNTLNAMLKFLSKNKPYSGQSSNKIYKSTDFLFELNIADVNYSKLARYMRISKISRKLSGYAKSLSNEEMNQSRNSCPIVQIETFIICLKNSGNDSRILLTYSDDDFHLGSLKFITLAPAAHVKLLFTESRSVILTGGTMQPTSDLTVQLFQPIGIDDSKVKMFSFDHVIPSNNILPIALSHGPSNKRLEFTFETRKKPDLINEFGRLILNLCNITPGGIVCFFASYDYETFVFEQLSASGLLNRIEAKKKFFREPKESSSLVGGSGTLTDFVPACESFFVIPVIFYLKANLLENYSRCIKLTKNHHETSAGNCKGAILFAVVGGKLSEGINFSDDLGRCIVMVGMPYACKESPELLERIKFLNEELSTEKKQVGQSYYESLCWKAINQSVGRAIRHDKDYAAIILLDARYIEKSSITLALPQWIGKQLRSCHSFGTCLREIKRFFDYHHNV